MGKTCLECGHFYVVSPSRGQGERRKVIITKEVVVPDYKAQENSIVLEVTQEISPVNPREWDNFGKMVCWHPRYILGDKQINAQYEADGILLEMLDEKFDLSEFQKESIRYYAETDVLMRAVSKHTKTVMLSLYLYDHSGITMSASARTFSMIDSAGWDWGTVGIIYATEKTIKKEFGVTEVTDEVREKAERLLRSEVYNYDLYLRGEVYGFRLYNEETGEDIDSCWGFMGDPLKELQSEMRTGVAPEYKHMVDLLEPCEH